MMAFLNLVIVLSFALATAHVKTDVWEHVNTRPDPRRERVNVSKTQFEATRRALIAAGGTNWSSCDFTGEDWTETLIFEDLPVSATEKTMLVEAGPSCARVVKDQTGPCGCFASKVRNLCCLRVRNKNSMDGSTQFSQRAVTDFETLSSVGI